MLSAAAEAQAFLTKTPEHFFSLYSPPRNDSQAKMARERLEEDLRFASKCVSVESTLFLQVLT